MADSRLWAFLRNRLESHGFTGTGGQTRLRTLLAEKHQIPLTAAAVSLWFTGEGTPKLTTLLVLLDVLDVYGEERARAIDLAAGRGEIAAPEPASDAPEAAAVAEAKRDGVITPPEAQAILARCSEAKQEIAEIEAAVAPALREVARG